MGFDILVTYVLLQRVIGYIEVFSDELGNSGEKPVSKACPIKGHVVWQYEVLSIDSIFSLQNKNSLRHENTKYDSQFISILISSLNVSRFPAREYVLL